MVGSSLKVSFRNRLAYQNNGIELILRYSIQDTILPIPFHERRQLCFNDDQILLIFLERGLIHSFTTDLHALIL